MPLTKEEEWALGCVSIHALAEDAYSLVVDRLHPAIASLIDKGILRKVWIIDEEALEEARK